MPSGRGGWIFFFEDIGVQRSNDGMPAVRGALDAFIAELKWGNGLNTKHVCGKIGGPANLIGA